VINFEARFDDLRPLETALARMADFKADLRELIPEMERILETENRLARLQAVDKDGAPLLDAVPATIKRRGPGTVMVPHGDASRLIANHEVQHASLRPDHLIFRAVWRGRGRNRVHWIPFHARGAGRLPIRDVMGVTPEGTQFVTDVFHEYVRRRVEEVFLRQLGLEHLP
jgi:hypothetical protein